MTEHCSPYILSSTNGLDSDLIGLQSGDSGNRTSPGILAISQFTSYRDNLIVCGPASTTTDTGLSSSNQTPGTSGSTAGHDLFGVYRPTVDGTPRFTPLGRVSSSVIRGRITALASLPESGLLLLGDTHGHLSLIY
ncbi:unnamed protein product [Echinostoma caproni]|uniref:PQQ_3 domain-containing protein n=1 Tax=Echinostoma caproni TaxID=27848 RepID=A0A183AS17_9TREM|nr:unnamed protein product [Echinostoma caproni]